MKNEWLDKWENAYKTDEYIFGKAPNQFLKEELARLTPGTILFAAEGEGRNAVFAAKQGWIVTAFDISAEGRKKAMQLAKENKVQVDYEVGELPSLSLRYPKFDALALIYAHFPASIKSSYHRRLASLVKEHGIVIFEAFSKKHLGYRAQNPSVGGPADLESLFSIAEIRADFQDFEFLLLEEKTIELSEGHRHNGQGAVIRFVAKKTKSDSEYQALASQLRCPHGAEAAAFGEAMFQNNRGMVYATIEEAKIQAGDTVLEIGFGSGLHLPYLFEKVGEIRYFGLDTSEAMLAYAATVSVPNVPAAYISLAQTNGNGTLDFEDGFFDSVFTINTLYFMHHPLHHLQEIWRCLRKGGRLTLAFVEKSFADTLPFTPFGFTLYSQEDLQKIVREAGFESVQTKSLINETKTKDGQRAQVPFVVTSAFK